MMKLLNLIGTELKKKLNMEPEIGRFYNNKTWRFLAPSLKGHGKLFTEKLNPLWKLAFGVMDSFLEGSPILENKRPIFIMFDTKYNEIKVQSFIDWIQYQSYYLADYCPDVEIIDSRRHMCVVQVPKEFEKAYDHFLKGEYSKMYSKSEISHLFYLKDRIRDKDTILKKEYILRMYKRTLIKEFGIIPETIKEYELPPKQKEEIFFYEGKKVYF